VAVAFKANLTAMVRRLGRFGPTVGDPITAHADPYGHEPRTSFCMWAMAASRDLACPHSVAQVRSACRVN